MLENKDDILKMFKEIKTFQTLEKIEDSIRLGQIFIDFKLLIPLERHAHAQEDAKKKYPKHLGPSRPQAWKMTDKGFYSWNTPKPTKKLAILLVVGIIITFAFMCFSIWPLWLKIGIWYFSFYTLIILVISNNHVISSVVDGLYHSEIGCLACTVPLWC